MIVPQENTIAFNEPILIDPSLPSATSSSLHVGTSCRSTHSHALHMDRHLANHSAELRRSSLNSVHLAPESSHTILDQSRASYIPQKQASKHKLLYDTTQLRLKGISRTLKTFTRRVTVNLKLEKIQINSSSLHFTGARVVPNISSAPAVIITLHDKTVSTPPKGRHKKDIEAITGIAATTIEAKYCHL